MSVLKNLIIIGAGGYGREIYSLSQKCKGYGHQFEVKGFLDSNPHALEHRPNYPEVLSTVEDYIIETDDVFVIAIANINSRKLCVEQIKNKGGFFYNLIHETAVIAQNTVIGEGCILGRDVIISNDCIIGNHCSFNSKAMVGHDSILGDYCNINAGGFIGGECILGKGVTLHTYGIIAPRIVIEDEAVIGAGSVVIRSVKSGTTVFGNPAKVIS